MRVVNQSVPKVDSQALVTGKGVYTDDLAPGDCLIVKVLRSPHAHALIPGQIYHGGADLSGAKPL